jgi:hypothetical protein
MSIEHFKKHCLAMAFIYMNWSHLVGLDIPAKEIADWMEHQYSRSYGKLERNELANQMEKGFTHRDDSTMPDYWKEAIRIIKSRTEYF